MNIVPDDVRLAQRLRPQEQPVMYQSWHKLLFLHWRFDPDIIQSLLPDGLTVDTHDHSAWVGVVPFWMKRIRPSWSPTVPYISNFLELNLRTYAINDQGVPGVWFLSLDTSRLLAVAVARTWFKLPYYWASMSARIDRDNWINYRSRRFFRGRALESRFRHRPSGDTFYAEPGTLEFFLAERYILFAELGRGCIATGQVHHSPYPLRRVDVQSYDDHVLKLAGLAVSELTFDNALYSEGVDVEVFALRPPQGSKRSR